MDNKKLLRVKGTVSYFAKTPVKEQSEKHMINTKILLDYQFRFLYSFGV